MSRNMALNEHYVFLRVQAAGDILRQKRNRVFAELCSFLPNGYSVHVHNTENAVVFILKRDPVLKRTEVISESD